VLDCQFGHPAGLPADREPRQPRRPQDGARIDGVGGGASRGAGLLWRSGRGQTAATGMYIDIYRYVCMYIDR